MIDQQERHYNILKLNKWFALSSIVFIAIFLLVFGNDYNRPWKKYQKEFRKLEIEAIQNELADLNSGLDQNEIYQSLQENLHKTESILESKKDEINTLKDQIKNIEAERYRINQNHQFAKAELDVAKYNVDNARHGQANQLNEATIELNKVNKLTASFKLELENVDKKLDSLTSHLDQLFNEQKTLNNEINSIGRKRDLSLRKLRKTDPSEMTLANKIGNIVRDLPVLDFIDPYYEVKQVVIKDLEEDLVYLGMPIVDRCMTCHLGIDKKGFENAPQPYTTHPKIDLMVGADSKHPVSEYGCTTCHAGRGRGVDFSSSAHSPRNDEQKDQWEEKYQWELMHHWDKPMLPMQYVEAPCYKCHSGTMPVKEAETLSLGLAIVEKGGCFGCHEIERWKNTPKPGPGLKKIASKTTKEFVYNWISAPREFRHDTWMPHFFNQINTRDTSSINRSNQEIHAIVEYLFDQSDSYNMEKIAFDGNAKNGEKLVKSIGCLGCHRINEDTTEVIKPSFDTMRRQQGPNLNYLGSKTTKQWIYNWIRNPQSYHSQSRMPNMRLSEKEAADVSVFLASGHNQEFEEKLIPQVDENELNKIVESFLIQTDRKELVDSKIAQMNVHEKLMYSGDKLIRHYGCFGCHEIEGFENAKPIGTSLTYEGSKLITKLDFGFLHDEVPHTKWDWFRTKLNNPRIFDMIPVGNGAYHLKNVTDLDKLRMPHYGLSNDELDAIVTVIMGLVKEDIPASKLPERSTKYLIVEEGERLIQTYNCKGCHQIDGDGGTISSSISDWLTEIADENTGNDRSLVQSFSPPKLDTEGKRVQPNWLFNFFQGPTMIRPNLQVRMPSFNSISDADWNKIIKYFQYKDNQMLAYEEHDQSVMLGKYYRAGEKIQEFGACTNCHFYGNQKPKQSALTWAPNLAMSKERLRPEWMIEFFKNPQTIIPGTKMPAPYIPTEEPLEDVYQNWGKSVAEIKNDSTKLYQGLVDYIWQLKGQQDVSSIVKYHLETVGYGFILESSQNDGEEW